MGRNGGNKRDGCGAEAVKGLGGGGAAAGPPGRGGACVCADINMKHLSKYNIWEVF